MLLNAKQILVSELVLAEQKDLTEIESIVENKINESYEEHVATLEQNIVKQNAIEDHIVKKLIPKN